MLEIGSVKNKIALMKRKGEFKKNEFMGRARSNGKGKRTKEWFTKIEEKRNGLKIKVGYMKIRMDGNLYR